LRATCWGCATASPAHAGGARYGAATNSNPCRPSRSGPRHEPVCWNKWGVWGITRLKLFSRPRRAILACPSRRTAARACENRIVQGERRIRDSPCRAHLRFTNPDVPVTTFCTAVATVPQPPAPIGPAPKASPWNHRHRCHHCHGCRLAEQTQPRRCNRQ